MAISRPIQSTFAFCLACLVGLILTLTLVRSRRSKLRSLLSWLEEHCPILRATVEGASATDVMGLLKTIAQLVSALTLSTKATSLNTFTD